MARCDFPSSKQDQFVVRLPDGMRDEIKAAAREAGRSMNSELVTRLQEYSNSHLLAASGSNRALREHFAGLAMQGIMATEGVDVVYSLEMVATRAVGLADALIAELSKTEGGA